MWNFISILMNFCLWETNFRMQKFSVRQVRVNERFSGENLFLVFIVWQTVSLESFDFEYESDMLVI